MINKFLTTNIQSRRCAVVLAACVGAFIHATSYAQVPMEIAKIPLEVGASASAPNVLIVADNSRSMDWEIIYLENQPDNSLPYVTGTYFYGYLFNYGNIFEHDLNDNDGQVVPMCEFITANFNTHPNRLKFLELCWKMRSPVFNTLYYNPDKTYVPWLGYADSPVNAAPIAPGSGTTVNLTAATGLKVRIPNDFTKLSYKEKTELYPYTSPVNLAFYYDAGANKVELTSAEELQNFANWFTYYRRRMFTAQGSLVAAIDAVDGVKLAYSGLNSNWKDIGSNKVPFSTNSFNKAEVKAKIFSTTINEVTPLRSALYEAGKYFQCEYPNIMFETESANPGGCVMPVNSPANECQQNSTILITDGYWDNDDTYTGRRTTEYNMSYNATAFSSVNYDKSNSAFAGGPFADEQSKTLADVAMYFYMTDLSSTADKVPPTDVDKKRIANRGYWTPGKTMHQHMKTSTVGFGVLGDGSNFPDYPDNLASWPGGINFWPTIDLDNKSTPTKTKDLAHAAYNGRGKYIGANDASQLTAGLTELLKGASLSGGSLAALSFDSQTLETNSHLYSASFDAENSAGDVVSKTISVNGVITTEASDWSAAALLENKVGTCTTSDTRRIVTFHPDGTNSTEIPFTYAALQAHGYADDATVPSSGLTSAIVGWLRGSRANEVGSACAGANPVLRKRETHKLIGDIANSKPLFVGPPNFAGRAGGAYPTSTTYDSFKAKFSTGGAYANQRENMIVVGTNGGMLHVFNDQGEELLAYVPNQLVQGLDAPKVSKLASPNYAHEFFIDLPPAVNDVFIATPFSQTVDWRTVLIGGYRAGGKGYFALDLTTNTSMPANAAHDENTTNSHKKVMWEMTASDVPDDTLGYTFSPPLIAMINAPADTNNASLGNQWRAIFGNGYNSVSGDASLVLADIAGYNDGAWTAADFTIVQAFDGSGAAATDTVNGLSTPRGIDVDGNGTVDYMYAGDLLGNVYRFDLTDPSNITSRKIFTAKSDTNEIQPIITQPYVVPSPNGGSKYIVVVSTGNWLTENDGLSTAVQSVYGIEDDVTTTPVAAFTRANLSERVVKNVDVMVNGVTQKRRIITGSAINWIGDSTATPAVAAQKGWYMDLDVVHENAAPNTLSANPGERAVRNFIERGGYLFFNTVFPGSNSCTTNLGGAVMSLNPQTGLVEKAIWDFGNDGAYDTDGDRNIAGGEYTESLSGGGMIGSRYTVNTTDDAGNVVTKALDTNTKATGRSGRLSWRQVK